MGSRRLTNCAKQQKGAVSYKVHLNVGVPEKNAKKCRKHVGVVNKLANEVVLLIKDYDYAFNTHTGTNGRNIHKKFLHYFV